MLTPAPIKFRRQRRPIKAPPANQILSVSHDTVSNRLIVVVSATLGDMAFAGAIQVSADGVTWVSSVGGNFNAPPQVLFNFSASIVTRTQWKIVDPTLWVFEDGRPLMPPFEGTIA